MLFSIYDGSNYSQYNLLHHSSFTFLQILPSWVTFIHKWEQLSALIFMEKKDQSEMMWIHNNDSPDPLVTESCMYSYSLLQDTVCCCWVACSSKLSVLIQLDWNLFHFLYVFINRLDCAQPSNEQFETWLRQLVSQLELSQ